MNRCFNCLLEIQANKNVQYGLHHECFIKWFELDGASEFLNLSQKSNDDLDQKSEKNEFSKINSSFYHGKFRKYSAHLGQYEYILKVREKDFPELPATEFLSNQIARYLKIKVADFYLISFDGAQTFVTRNFMHQYSPGNLIHFYHYLDKPSDFHCSKMIEIIKKQTGRAIEAERFIELILFDALIGNHDRHGRNLAFIETSKGKVLSPFYDNPSYIGIEIPEILGAQLSPRGAIATSKTSEPTLIDYTNELIRLGFRSNIEKFLKKIDSYAIESLIKTSFISPKRQKAFLKLITSRYKELTNELISQS